jgi:hypothetical protein
LSIKQGVYWAQVSSKALPTKKKNKGKEEYQAMCRIKGKQTYISVFLEQTCEKATQSQFYSESNTITLDQIK